MPYVNAPYTGIKIFRCSLRDNLTIFAFHKIAEKNGSWGFFVKWLFLGYNKENSLPWQKILSAEIKYTQRQDKNMLTSEDNAVAFVSIGASGM